METIGIRELRQHASRVLDRVRRGEVVVVTDRGRAVARIYPEPDSEWSSLVESGQLRTPTSTTALQDIEPIAGSLCGSALLEELRAEER